MTIVVQVGQAGNQVGGELWGILERESRAWGDDDAGRDSLLAPSGLLRETPSGALRARGRGNNWAHGYRQPGGGSEAELLELAREGIRAEAERCDGPLDLVLLHSLAGGTGSGLGSALLESLRAEYSREYVLAAAVAPRLDGDSTLQSLNTLLVAQWHQAYADAVILFNNDGLLRAAAATRGQGGGLTSVNRYIGGVLAGCLNPLAPGAPGGVREIVTGAAPDPSLKFLDGHTAPAPELGSPAAAATVPPPWSSVFRELTTRAARFEGGGRRGAAMTTSTATVAMARGTGTRGAGAEGEGVGEVLRALNGPSSPYQHPSWEGAGAGDDAVTVLPSPPPALPANGLPRTLTVISNRSSSAGLLAAAVCRAEPMIRAGAYAHWYERYGCPREALWDALDATANIVESYGHWHGAGGW